MTTYYVKSTAGGTADGLSWANAFLTLAAADAVDAAGDVIYVSQAHNESTAALVALSFAGTHAAPTHVICVNDAAEPPTAVATGAIVATTGASHLRISGNAYFEGITFNCGNAANYAQMSINFTGVGITQTYRNCSFVQISTHPSSFVIVGSQTGGAPSSTTLVDCTFKLAATGQYYALSGDICISGGSFAAGTSTPSSGVFLFGATSKNCNAQIDNFDYSNLSSTASLCRSSSTVGGRSVFRNSSVPSSWSGAFVASALLSPESRVELYNCDNTTNDWLLWIEDYCGSIRSETTLVRTGSLADYSLKMVSSSKANEAFGHLKSNEIFLAVGTPGSAQTATFEILHDSVTNLTDAEVWVEVEYRDTSGSRRSVELTDHRATLLTTATDQATSAVTWTTTGMTNPNKQKLSVTFTPQVAGYSVARIVLAKPSKTVYVDLDSGVV